MSRKALAVACFALVSSLLVAQTGYRLKSRAAAELIADQKVVVGNYCRLDFEGARMKDGGWERLRPLTGQKNNPDFVSFVIVSRYQVSQSELFSWNADVNYTVIGRFDPIVGFTPEPGIEVVTFRTKDADGVMQIMEITPGNPHVSKRAALDWLKARAADAKIGDLERKQTLKAIETLEPKPAAVQATGEKQ